MPTRRTFLQASLLAMSLPLTPWLQAAQSALRILVDRHCTDSDAFAAQCGNMIAVGADPAALLSALDDEGAGADPLFGLTRDAHHFLFEQLAVPRGYRLTYRGIHDYRSGRLEHSLSGNAVIMRRTAGRLGASGERWPGALAAALPELARSESTAATTRLATTVGKPAGSPGYLVSWCLRRV